MALARICNLLSVVFRTFNWARGYLSFWFRGN